MDKLALPHHRYVELQERLMQDINPKVFNSKGMKYWEVVDKVEFTLNEFGIIDADARRDQEGEQ